MEKGKLYSDPENYLKLIEEMRAEMPKIPSIPPYVIQDGELSKKQAMALDDYLRKDIAWKFKWLGEGRYIDGI